MVAGWSSSQRSSIDGLAEQPAQARRSVASIVRDHGPLAVADAVDITLDLCEALAAAHANGVVHGDLGLHRVRTAWPRVPGGSVDIFARGEADSAAHPSVRAAKGLLLVAPEQRESQIVDQRADIWAVGAMLRFMLVGAPAGSGAPARELAHVPRAIVACIEACLADRPADRPDSVDAIAEAIGSFAPSAPERFEQLARRRAARARAARPRGDLAEVDRVLRRLDDAALNRELAGAAGAAAPAGSSTEIALQRLASAVDHATGALDANTLAPLTDDEMDIATTFLERPARRARPIAAPSVEPAPSKAAAPAPHVVLSHADHVAPVAAAAEPPPEATPPAATEAAAPVGARGPSLLLRAVGGLAALALGVPIGIWLVESARAPGTTWPAVAAAVAEASGARERPLEKAAPAAERTPAPLPPPRTPVTLPAGNTPASLPDAPAPPAADTARAEVPLWTPAALPDAPPLERRAGAR